MQQNIANLIPSQSLVNNLQSLIKIFLKLQSAGIVDLFVYITLVIYMYITNLHKYFYAYVTIYTTLRLSHMTRLTGMCIGQESCH